MDCRDVRELADSFVGGELLTETNHQILRHLESCPSCRADVAARRALRSALRGAFERTPDLAPDDRFVVGLRERLQRAAATPNRSRFALPSWALTAATLVIAAGLAASAWVGIRFTAGAIARAAVGDHRNCALTFRLAEKPISLEEAAQRFDRSYRALESAPPRDLTPILGAGRVLERHSCVYGGRRFAHIVIEYRGSVVSLLVTTTGSNPFAGAPPRDTWSRRQVDSMSVAARSASGHAIVLVGALEQADMDRLVDLVATPLFEQLTGA